jgi:molybdopterin-guanine dinucleotide biosynthesis protein A
VPQDAAKPPPSPTGNPAFSAVLLAGGKSTRMGRDKAALMFEGRPSWQRQLATLTALHPDEIFISGKADGPYAGAGIEIIGDLHPGRGPLSGIEAACWRMKTPLLCVLAVDLPWMTPAFLDRLVKIAMQDGRGVVPQTGEYYEPLAAVYPRAVLTVVGEHLRHTDHSMQHLVRRAAELDLVIPYPLCDEDRLLFHNVNTPADLAG